MDLSKKYLPDTVMVSGKLFEIQTSHFFWFSFAKLLNQDNCTYTDFDFLYKNDDYPTDRAAGFDELIKFYHEEKDLPRFLSGNNDKILDYEIDSDLIYAGILEQYGIDLFDYDIHWHKVRAMMAGLHDTKLSDIIGYRCYSGTDKSMIKIKQQWDLPQKMSEAEQTSSARFLELLKK